MAFCGRDQRAGFERAHDGKTPPLDWRDGDLFGETLSPGQSARAEHAALEAELRAGQRAAARRWPLCQNNTDRLFRMMRGRLLHLWELVHQSDTQTHLGVYRGE